jgi:hypothetical protein
MLKALPLVDMAPNERRLIEFVLTNGVKRVWRNYQQQNLAGILALHLGMSETSAKVALISLRKKGWLVQGTDLNDHHELRIGETFHDECNLALARRTVRAACGLDLWANLHGDAALADQLWDAVTLGIPPDLLRKAPTNYTTLDMQRLSTRQQKFVESGVLTAVKLRQEIKLEAQKALRIRGPRVRKPDLAGPETGPRRSGNRTPKVVPIRKNAG